MTDHPCKGMTKRQIEVFEQIAIGERLPRAHPKSLDKLLARGLIRRDADKTIGRDRFGPVTIPQYSVPLPIHVQWCEWCHESVPDGVFE